MKKQLRSELVSIAHRILKMNAEADYATMQQDAKRLYDTLTILVFAEKHFDGVQPSIGKAQLIEALQKKDPEEVEQIIEQVETPQKPVESRDENLRRMDEIARANELLFQKARKEREQNQPTANQQTEAPKNTSNQSSLYEPVIEKIKDMVAMMPPEADAIDDMFRRITNDSPIKNDRDEIGEYGRQAEFQKKDKSDTRTTPSRTSYQESIPKEQPQPEEPRQKSLNDRLTRGLKIGLNDRIVFIKHLFNGNATDYNRVLSQLNTQQSREEALHFIDQMVKPDYNNWEGKELYESRFKDLVIKKFEA